MLDPNKIQIRLLLYHQNFLTLDLSICLISFYVSIRSMMHGHKHANMDIKKRLVVVTASLSTIGTYS